MDDAMFARCYTGATFNNGIQNLPTNNNFGKKLQQSFV